MERIVGEKDDPQETEGKGFALPDNVEDMLQNPAAKKAVLQQAEQLGIHPVIARAFLPGEDVGPEDVQEVAQSEQNAIDETPEPTPEPTPEVSEGEAPDVNLDTVESILAEVESLLGKDTTVGELQEFVEDNPDIVQNAIDIGDM